jgi:hypothetical protein
VGHGEGRLDPVGGEPVPAVAAADVVDQHVHRSVGAQRTGQVADLGERGQVGADEAGRCRAGRVEVGTGRRAPGRVPADDGDRVAPCGEAARGGEADSPGTAGDDGGACTILHD